MLGSSIICFLDPKFYFCTVSGHHYKHHCIVPALFNIAIPSLENTGITGWKVISVISQLVCFTPTGSHDAKKPMLKLQWIDCLWLTWLHWDYFGIWWAGLHGPDFWFKCQGRDDVLLWFPFPPYYRTTVYRASSQLWLQDTLPWSKSLQRQAEYSDKIIKTKINYFVLVIADRTNIST